VKKKQDMRKISMIVGLALTVCFAQAQNFKEGEAPAAVRDALTKSFPEVANVTWSKGNANEFEAQFTEGGVKHAVNFDGAGNWLGTEKEISKADLPENVVETIKKELPDYELGDAKQMENPSIGIFYEVEVGKGESKYDAQLSIDGRVLGVKAKERK
jgi:hypothetical protein